MEQPQEAQYRIGVDVGGENPLFPNCSILKTEPVIGTNTDAVLISIDPGSIIASHKAPTTADITTGITNAARAVIESSNVPLAAIGCVIIGTTHFVNAVVQRSASLRRVGTVRLCGGPEEGFGRGIPPFTDFPPDLRLRLQSQQPYFCHGGYQVSRDVISELDEEELAQVAASLVEEGIGDVAVSGMYAPLNPEQEIKARDVMSETMRRLAKPGFKPRITLSHEVSSLGFLARENAAILNAALRPLAERTIHGFQMAMADIFQGNKYTLYLTQNDGSILSATEAIDMPIRTFNSGPTNSIRGGEFLWRTVASLSGEQQRVSSRTEPLVVVDIGGTTSDSGLLLPNGLLQMSSIMSVIGGVRTNFALPAVESIALGGGTIIKETKNGELSVGPESVGHELLSKSRLFGGEYLTATDIVVASLRHSAASPLHGMGDPTAVANIDSEVINGAQRIMRYKIEDLVDRTKIQQGDVDVLIVGGGAHLVGDEPLSGVRMVRTVKGGEVANAVGAAISRVSGTIDTVVDISSRTAKEAQEEIVQLAIEKAVANGALPGTVEIVEVTVLPIQYVEAKSRMIVRAIGQLGAVAKQDAGEQSATANGVDAQIDLEPNPLTHTPDPNPEPVDLKAYRPTIQSNQWIISPTDLDLIAQGCKILGCGGGGDPYQEYLKVKAMIRQRPGIARVVSLDYLAEDNLVGWTGCMGSPEVSMERLENNECLKAHDELIRVTRSAAVSGFLALEIGGGNGVVNMGVSAHYGVSCLDGDFMGRAYPTAWQITPNVYGTSRGEALVPTTIASGDGSFITMTRSRTDRLVDRSLRASCVEMGCRVGSAGAPKTAGTVKRQAVANTVSLAWWIGRAVTMEKNVADKAQRIIDEVGGPGSAAILGEGKIINVSRVLKTGHSYGVLEVKGTLSGGSRALIKVPFKNENAFVEAISPQGNVSILASVPDLIAVIDAETGAGLGTPEYKYGLKVVIIAIAASPRWTDTERGLEIGGPGSMGFENIEYKPIGKYSKPRSVIEAFRFET